MRPRRRSSPVARLGRVALALVAVGVVAPWGASAAAARDDAAPPERVLVISAPHLTWDTVREESPPELMGLFGRSAVAAMSVRTIGPRTDIGSGYLTLGAGNRTVSDPGPDGLVLERTETLTTGDPASLFARSTGVDPVAPILALGIPQIIRANELEDFGAVPGALGGALAEVGRSIAVIGNSDETADSPTERHAGLFGIDPDGQLAGGAVGRQLLEVDPASPFGVRLHADTVVAATEQAWADSDVVLVEMSDLRRAEQARRLSTPDQADRLFRDALLHDDAIVGRVLDSVEASGIPTRIMVVAPASPTEVEQTTVFSIAGPGIDDSGLATSSTTRRDGYVTLTDVAPTILDMWDVDIPDSMGDTPISAASGDGDLGSRIDGLIDANDRAVVRDAVFGRLTVIFIVVLAVDLVLAVVCLARVRRLAGLVQVLSLVVLAVPSVAFLVGLLPMGSMSALGLGLTVFGAALAVAVVAWRWGQGGDLPAPWYLVLALWAVLAADVVTGANLQINTIFGYSPIVAGRFAGFGNQAFSMFAISALLLVAATSELFQPARREGRPFLVGATVFLVVSVVLDGYPGFGSDVGGVLALVPASAVLLLLLAEVRIRLRLVAAVTAGTLVVLGLFAALDLSRPAADRTHLGRFVTQVLDGEAGQVLERKVSANISVLDSIWSWIIPAALVYFAYLTWRPNQTLELLQRRHPWFRAFGISGLVLGLLSMVLNDSGVSMPAMMLAISLAYTTYLVIGLEVRRSDPDPPGTPGGDGAEDPSGVAGAARADAGREVATTR